MQKDKNKDTSIRQLKAAEVVRQALADVFFREDLPDSVLSGLSITVSEVRISKDLRAATAFVAPLAGKEIDRDEFLASLKKIATYLRILVTKKISLKYSPELFFKFDESFDNAVKIHGIIKDVVPEE